MGVNASLSRNRHSPSFILVVVVIAPEGAVVPHPELAGGAAAHLAILDSIARIDYPKSLVAIRPSLRHLEPGGIRAATDNLGGYP
jgi:hypothetical protein